MDLILRRVALFFSFFYVLQLVSAELDQALWGNQGEAMQNIIKEWNQTNEKFQTILLGWKRANDKMPCINGTDWNGIGCWGPITSLNDSNIRVKYYYITALQISDTQLNGTLPPSIGNLTNLGILSITDNPNLTGPIPASIIGLTRLNTMDLHGNDLTGTIPNWTEPTKSLTEIDFHRNRLEGSIPTLKKWHVLRVLDLSENFLIGLIPKVVPKRLKHLQLAHNRLSGDITCSSDGASKFAAPLHHIESLKTLNLSYNQLSGQLPQCWSNLTKLVTLDISNNTFSGSIDGSLFSNWTKLQYMYGDNNNFSGVLDLSQVNYTTMRQISLVNNSISSVIMPPKMTFSLSLGGNPGCNNINQIPASFCRYSNTIIIVKKGISFNLQST